MRNEPKGLGLAASAVLCSLIGWVPAIMMQVAPLSEYPARPGSLVLSPIAAIVWCALGLVLGLLALAKQSSGLAFALAVLAVELGGMLSLTGLVLPLFMLLPAGLLTVSLLLLAGLGAGLLVRKMPATSEDEGHRKPVYLAWTGLALATLAWLMLLEKGLRHPYGDDEVIYFRLVMLLAAAFVFSYSALLFRRRERLALVSLVLIPPAYAMAGCWYFLSLMY